MCKEQTVCFHSRSLSSGPEVTLDLKVSWTNGEASKNKWSWANVCPHLIWMCTLNYGLFYFNLPPPASLEALDSERLFYFSQIDTVNLHFFPFYIQATFLICVLPSMHSWRLSVRTVWTSERIFSMSPNAKTLSLVSCSSRVAIKLCLRETCCRSSAGWDWRRPVSSSHHSSFCWILWMNRRTVECDFSLSQHWEFIKDLNNT